MYFEIGFVLRFVHLTNCEILSQNLYLEIVLLCHLTCLLWFYKLYSYFYRHLGFINSCVRFMIKYIKNISNMARYIFLQTIRNHMGHNVTSTFFPYLIHSSNYGIQFITLRMLTFSPFFLPLLKFWNLHDNRSYSNHVITYLYVWTLNLDAS